MENIYFEFMGTTYSGYLLNEATDDPRYFWFVFNEDEMSRLFGETIAFYISDGQLLPVYEYTTKASFIEYLRGKVETALSAKALFKETTLLKKVK